ncbi:hypothetical protein D3C81_1299660 [compost metagenome]
MKFLYLGQDDDGGGEAAQPFFIVLARAYADEHGHGQAHFLPVHDGHAALDITLFLQALDPLPARRAGQTDLLAEGGDRQGAILLQGRQDGAVEFVERGVW